MIRINLHPGSRKFIFWINFIEKFTPKQLLWQHFSLLKNKESYLLLLEEEKTSICQNKFASGKPRQQNEFYLPNECLSLWI